MFQADLSGAILRGADLRDADLHSADLRPADLAGADLRGAVYSEDTLWPLEFNPAGTGAIKRP
jgi:uncharacterized protein YjbI with pentapeptide repeats